MTNQLQNIEEIIESAQALKERVMVLEAEQEEREKAARRVSNVIAKDMGKAIHKDIFVDFFKKPYVTIPQGKTKMLVAIPKFIKDFQVGWLWKETDTFFIYQFDQYSSWLGDAPKELLEEIGFEKDLTVVIENGVVTFTTDQKDTVKKKLGTHLREVGDTEARIKRGHEFDVIAESVKNGCLPFRYGKVPQSDLREAQSKIKPRSYQKEAIDEFLNVGSIGVFHPTGAGKSFTAMYLMDIVKGNKLLVVPTRTLVEQWEHYIKQNIPHAKNEVRITTYQGYRQADDIYSLVIFDECQRLPADTFSRLALIPTKYRVGLSASPHREDGREHYIFALTGKPVGLNWQEYMDTVGKSYHPIHVHVTASIAGKMAKIRSLLDDKKKTIVFCDTIELGKKISKQFDMPFIYGESKNRVAQIQNAKHVCLSRVGDLGVSVKDLQRIIEVDFLYGSRQQELQRTGRLMHSEKAERHDIVMTEKEMQAHGKRLWALQEKGFSIKVA